jgi:hypothetical protein
MKLKSNAIDSMPVWVFRPASKFATWFLSLSALAVALVEVLHSTGEGIHLLGHAELENALVWGEILLLVSAVAIVGELFNRTGVAAAGVFGCALWYLAFSLAAVHDHTEQGGPELILPIMTFTLAAMYMVVGSMKVFHLFIGYYKDQ